MSDALLRVAQLAALSPLDIDPARETQERIDYEDGGFMLRYQYLFDPSDFVFVNAYLAVAPDLEEAQSDFEQFEEGVADLDFESQRDDRLDWPDDSATWRLVQKERTIGHAILLRRGVATLFLVFIGFVFEGDKALRDLLRPKWEALGRPE